MTTAPATFTRNISQPTLEYLNSLPFKTWDCFQTPGRNLEVMHYANIERPKQRIFREFESGHEIRFTVNNNGTVSMSTVSMLNYENENAANVRNVWTPFAIELHSLLLRYDVQNPAAPTKSEEEKAQAAYDAKVARLEGLDYAILYKIYNAIEAAPKRRGLKKDRASLVRRLAKIL